jgi:hypothetical protein
MLGYCWDYESKEVRVQDFEKFHHTNSAKHAFRLLMSSE